MIGIDVGGANVKVVDDMNVHIHYCPLWLHAPLPDILQRYAGNDAAVVMSGEQADSFSTKQEGIEYIVRSVREVFPAARFYGMDGTFHRDAVPELSAANWLASADFLRSDYPDSVFIDMGSTTTDIIPLHAFEDLRNMSDLTRLQKGYLIYTGLLRTPVPAVLRSVMIGGEETFISSEYFAVSADAHLALGHISEPEYTISPPDRGEKTYEASLQRLSRLVCSDLGEIGPKEAMSIAEQFWVAQKSMIRAQIRRVMEETGASSVIMAGIGSGLLARELDGTDLREQLGVFSDALPAYAVRRVALRNDGL